MQENTTIDRDDNLLDLFNEFDDLGNDPGSDMDITELLDATYEDAVTPEEIIFTEDYSDTQEGISLYGIKDDIRFDYDEDIDNSDKDEELISTLQNELRSKGYKFIERYDYEQLTKLHELEETAFNTDLLEIQREGLVYQFGELKSEIVASKATLSNNRNSYIRYTDKLDLKSKLDKGFLNRVNETISQLAMNENNEVNGSTVTATLLDKGLASDFKKYLETTEYYEYLQVAIPTIIAAVKLENSYEKNSEMQREKVTSYLLHDEAEAILAISDSSYSFIKQIFQNGTDYLYYCAACDTQVKLSNDIFSFILYASEQRDYKNALSPKLIKCPKCGHAHLLPIVWYIDIMDNLVKVYKKGAEELFKFLNKSSTGTSLTKVIPSTFNIFESIEPIINIDADIVNPETITENQEVEKYEYNDFEYKEAITNFYNKLLLFKQPTNTKLENENEDNDNLEFDDFSNIELSSDLDVTTDRLTIREMAICLTSELSLDYHVVKNKALYSLIMALEEFDFFKDALNREAYWELLNKRIILKAAVKITENDKELINIISSLCNFKFSDNSMLKELKDEAVKALAEVDDKIDKFEAEYHFIIDDVKSNMDLFAHIKILNVNQINLPLLIKYVNSSEFAKIIDELTDKMIINNYAENYADILLNSSALNNNNLRKQLLIGTDSFVGTQIASYAEKKLGIILNNNVISRLSVVSANHLHPIKEAAEALKHYDYYRFIVNLSAMNDDCYTLISPNADIALKEAIELANTKYDKIKGVSYLKFYLQDFSEADFDNLDIETRNKLLNINFERFIPKKLDSETLKDYTERYENLEASGLISTVECYDFKDFFNDFKNYFSVIMNGANVLLLDSTNFTLANFTRCWLMLCCDVFSRQTSLDLLGYNEAYFNRLNSLIQYHFNAETFTFADSLYKVLNGYYVSSCESFLQKYVNEFNYAVLDERYDLSRAKFTSVKDILNDLEQLTDDDLVRIEKDYNIVKNKDNLKKESETSVSPSIDVVEDISALKEDFAIEIEQFI